MFKGIATNFVLDKKDLKKIMTLPIEKINSYSPVNVVILKDKEELYQHFAKTITNKIKENNNNGNISKFILPVGPTPQYRIIAEITNKERISWKNVWTFNMDEYLDWEGRVISYNHPMSFKRYIYENLFNLIDRELSINENNIFFPDPKNPDEIQTIIEKIGGIDICFGGIGYHGHIAFNEPIDNYYNNITPDLFMKSKTRIVELNSDSIVVNSICGAYGNYFDTPKRAVTLGMKVILDSKEIKLYCDGGDFRWQPASFRIACMHPVTMDRPVTFIHKHNNPKKTVTIYADELTAEPIIINPK